MHELDMHELVSLRSSPPRLLLDIELRSFVNIFTLGGKFKF